MTQELIVGILLLGVLGLVWMTFASDAQDRTAGKQGHRAAEGRDNDGSSKTNGGTQFSHLKA